MESEQGYHKGIRTPVCAQNKQAFPSDRSLPQGPQLPHSPGPPSPPGALALSAGNSSMPCVYLKPHSCCARPVWSPPAPHTRCHNLQPRQTRAPAASQGEPKSAPAERAPAAEPMPEAHLSSQLSPDAADKTQSTLASHSKGEVEEPPRCCRARERRSRSEHGAADRGAHLPASARGGRRGPRPPPASHLSGGRASLRRRSRPPPPAPPDSPRSRPRKGRSGGRGPRW